MWWYYKVNKIININIISREWRGLYMFSQDVINKRAAYLNCEIVNEFSNKMKTTNLSKKDIANKYNLSKADVEYMLDENNYYDINMLKVASDFLNIPFSELTSILEDDGHVSCRGNVDDETNELFDIINFLFDDMIKQERMANVR